MIFLDTNIFLRAMVGDDPVKATSCQRLFKQIEDGHLAVTSHAVIAEIVYVLSSPRHYGYGHNEIRIRLEPYINLTGLVLPEKSRILAALDIYGNHQQLDFEDCLIAAQIEQEGIETLVSYDRGFDRLKTVQRSEPDDL